MGKLDGKVAIITGAGRGHAEAVARRLAREGAAVSICDVIPAIELEDSVGSKTNGGKVLCFQTDVSKEGQVNKMVEETIEHFGTIDILANVVGIAGPTKDVWKMTLAEWKRTLDVNLDSTRDDTEEIWKNHKLQFWYGQTTAVPSCALCHFQDGGNRLH